MYDLNSCINLRPTVTIAIINATFAIGYWDVNSISNVFKANVYEGGKATNGYVASPDESGIFDSQVVR